MYWLSFVLLGGAAVTGTLLYFYPGLLPTEPLLLVHQGLSWGFVAYIAVHVVAQMVLGGVRQLLKMVTPRLAYGVGAAAAVTAGMAGAAVAYVAETSSLPTLALARTTAPPVLDGVGTDVAWQSAREAVVSTNRGFGLNGGEVDVHVRALHDGESAYFLFRWKDATRSQKHIPLQKTAEGWKLVHSNYHNNDENEYYEDKFAVMLARSSLAGGDAVNLGKQPIAGKPGPSNGLGLHATSDGSLADVWHWKSVRTGTTNQFDDNHFGPPLAVGKPGARYTGGYTQDPLPSGATIYDQNFSKVEGSPYVKLKYLPTDLNAQQARMGTFDPNPNASDAGEYSMQRSDVQPWSQALDDAVPVGTVIPSVIINQPLSGDRGDVAVHAKWQDGWWTLEAKRKLDTGSKFDQPITEGMYLWVAVFDHNQVRHTRHVRPLQLHLD
jgi:Ethylbenzene dehydrogenase